MFKRIVRRMTRQVVAAMAVLLFAAVLTVVLCHLHKSGMEEQADFEESYASVPVFFKVTDLDGSKIRGNAYIQGWMVDLFGERGMSPNLFPFVQEVHTRGSIGAKHYVTETDGTPVFVKQNVYFDGKWHETDTKIQVSRTQNLIGISSTRVAEELTEGWGGKIYWHEGYDESILMTDEFVCIVPEAMKEHTVVDLEFYYELVIDAHVVKETTLRRTFQVVGYFADPGNGNVYCPYPTMEYIHAYLNKAKNVEQIGAILNDNSQLDALRETVSKWFAEPNPTGEKTAWGRYGYEYYFYAMDIDDSMLQNLSTSMKNSLLLNQLAAAAVFAMSAGAGFLTGFLVIRGRKREIALMRTMGQTHVSIFFEFAFEQMFCIALGVLLGGWYTMWQPAKNLALFCGIYLVGLTLALIVFLRKNLLTTVKEDE